MKTFRAAPIAAAFLGLISVVHAQSQPSWQAIAPDATFVTGDTWTSSGITYRLYGVQSCIRGTYFTKPDGTKHDCGQVSMLYLVSTIERFKPFCYPVAQTQDGTTQYVICNVRVKGGVGDGTVLDIGTAVISMGYSFASITPDAKPVYAPYLVSQSIAKKQRRGLWAYDDVPDPNMIIINKLAPKP